eukprot:5656330-Pleurochrysis_carterae.AAC.1
MSVCEAEHRASLEGHSSRILVLWASDAADKLYAHAKIEARSCMYCAWLWMNSCASSAFSSRCNV